MLKELRQRRSEHNKQRNEVRQAGVYLEDLGLKAEELAGKRVLLVGGSAPSAAKDLLEVSGHNITAGAVTRKELARAAETDRYDVIGISNLVEDPIGEKDLYSVGPNDETLIEASRHLNPEGLIVFTSTHAPADAAAEAQGLKTWVAARTLADASRIEVAPLMKVSLDTGSGGFVKPTGMQQIGSRVTIRPAVQSQTV